MKDISLADRLRYRFDNIMSQGTAALLGYLFLLSAILILIVSIIVVVTGAHPSTEDASPTLTKTLWTSLMHTIDGGTIAGDDTGNIFWIVMMFFVTGGGIFIFSTLIGILTSGIEAKLDELRKGRSFVVEHDHTIILGWSPQIFAIISELVVANENKAYSCIVILAEKDKVEMEEEIRNRVGSTGKTRIVCRTGSPIDMSDLQIVNPNASRSIIILSSEATDPDSHVIKTILALTNNPHRRTQPYNIVAEIRDLRNLEVAHMIAPQEVELLPVSDLISRIAVQTCLQSGLSVVYIELLDFGGDEIYFKDEPGLAGKTFGEALFAFDTSSVIGLRSKDGGTVLNPPMDRKLQASDLIIAIAEDDDKIVLSGKSSFPIREEQIITTQPQPARPTRTLILGWNNRGSIVINELDNYIAAGSETTILAEVEGVEAVLAADCANLKNQKVTFRYGSTTHRRTLDELDIPRFEHIITLSYMDTLAAEDADARTLITLLHLRDISEKKGARFSIVSEMLDVRNRELAEVTRADDFIVSDKLISLMLSQVSENRELMDVLTDIFDPEGSEIHLKPITDYVQTGQSVSLYTLLEAARRRNETMIGYRIQAESGIQNKAYGVYLNQQKALSVTFAPEDKIIVISEM